MKKTKMEKGITLVALIITIVVLLILAAVAIAAIQNENILGHANNAAVKYNGSVTNEQGTLGEYENFLNNHVNGETIEPEEDEELTEEELAEIELMERYVLGPEKTGKIVAYVANIDSNFQVTSFIDDTNTIANASTTVTPLFTSLWIDNTKAIAYAKYNNKVYKIVADYTTTYLTESVEMIYKPEGREGTPVAYDSNGDGNTEEWVIITDRNGLVEIVSKDVAKDKDGNVLTLTLGSGDTSVTVTSDLDDDGIIGDNVDIAIASYNNAITTINNYCKSIVKEEIRDKVRSVGGTNNSATPYSSTKYDNWGDAITVDVASGDLQYEEDMAKLFYHGIAIVSADYWLASRVVVESSSYVHFGVRRVFEGMLDDNGLWLVDSGGSVRISNPSRGVRPVIINPSGI